MSNKRTTIYLRGKLYWAKIFGAPRPNYDGDAREWTFEFEPDEDSVAELEDQGLEDRLKDKSGKKGYENRKPFLILRRNEFKYDGSPNEHIRVVDADNQEWKGGLVGNGSEADVKLTIVDYGPRKKKGAYPTAIRILTHVPFEREEFPELDKNDERRKAARSKREVSDEQFARDFGVEQEPTPEEKPKARRKPAPITDDEDLDDDVPF